MLHTSGRRERKDIYLHHLGWVSWMVSWLMFSLRLTRSKKVSLTAGSGPPTILSAAFRIFGESPILPVRISSRNVSSEVGVVSLLVGWLDLLLQDNAAKCLLSEAALVKVRSQSSQRWMGMDFFRIISPRCAV